MLASVATAGLPQVRYTEILLHVVLEDGSSMSSNPLIVVDPGYSCPSDSFRDGTIRMRVPYLATNGHANPGCPISVRLTGYRPFSGRVEDGATIKLLRIGPHEGATVSRSNVNAPRTNPRPISATTARPACSTESSATTFASISSGRHRWPKRAPEWWRTVRPEFRSVRFARSPDAS